MNHLITTLALALALTLTATTTYADDTTTSGPTTCEERLEAARVLSLAQLERIDVLRVALEACEADHARCLMQRDECTGRRDELAGVVNGLRIDLVTERRENARLRADVVPPVVVWSVRVAAIASAGLTGYCVGRGCSPELTVGLAVGAVLLVVGDVVVEVVR